MRWSCTARIACSGSNVSCGISVAPGLQAGQDAGLVAEVVEERVDAQVAVVAGDLAARRPRRGRVERLPVCAQHALAAAGGAGGEQDVGDVVGRDGGGAGVDRGEIGAARDELVPRCRRPSSIGTRTMWRSAGSASRSRSAGLVGTEELARREQQRRLGAGQDVGGLAGGVAGVQRHQRRRRRSAWPGTRPPSARCSATRSRPGRRRCTPRSIIAAAACRTSARSCGERQRCRSSVTSASWSEMRSAIRSRTCGMVLSCASGHRCSSNKASAW